MLCSSHREIVVAKDPLCVLQLKRSAAALYSGCFDSGARFLAANFTIALAPPLIHVLSLRSHLSHGNFLPPTGLMLSFSSNGF